MIRQRRSRALTFVLVLFVSMATTLAFGQDVERMTKEDLREILGQEDLVVVDVRTGRDWKSSEFKIKGAMRPEIDIVKWAESQNKNTKFVLYCA